MHTNQIEMATSKNRIPSGTRYPLGAMFIIVIAMLATPIYLVHLEVMSLTGWQMFSPVLVMLAASGVGPALKEYYESQNLFFTGFLVFICGQFLIFSLFSESIDFIGLTCGAFIIGLTVGGSLMCAVYDYETENNGINALTEETSLN
jgi:hypothetical protein